MNPASRYYPPVTANTYRLNRLLYDLVKANQELRRSFLADRQAALAEAELSPEEREAIARVDLPGLVALGAHPFLARNLYSMVHRHEHPDEYVYF